MGGFIILL